MPMLLKSLQAIVLLVCCLLVFVFVVPFRIAIGCTDVLCVSVVQTAVDIISAYRDFLSTPAR